MPHAAVVCDVGVSLGELAAATVDHGKPEDIHAFQIRAFDDLLLFCAAASARVRCSPCRACSQCDVELGVLFVVCQSRALTFDGASWNPAQIQVLDMSKQRLQVQLRIRCCGIMSAKETGCSVCFVLQWANFSPLVNLRELNLVSNELTNITSTGLSACTTLHVLLLAGNKIATEENLHYLSFLPALDVVDLRDNPVMVISHAR